MLLENMFVDLCNYMRMIRSTFKAYHLVTRTKFHDLHIPTTADGYK